MSKPETSAETHEFVPYSSSIDRWCQQYLSNLKRYCGASRDAEIHRQPATTQGVDLSKLTDEQWAGAAESRKRQIFGEPASTSTAAPGLKPCPFCSGAPWIIQYEGWGPLKVRCATCGGLGPDKLDREAAIEAWNTRADAAPRLTAVEEALAELREMFPATYCQVRVTEFGHVRYDNGKIICTAAVDIHVQRMKEDDLHFKSTTLSETMQAVRKWKEANG